MPKVNNKTKKKPNRLPLKDSSTFLSFEKTHEKSDKYINFKENKEIEKSLIKIFNTRTSILPENDYYTYINYLWLEKMKKKETIGEKKFYSQIDDFRVVQEKVYEDLILLVKNYIRTNKTKQSTELGRIFSSFSKLSEKYAHSHIAGFTQIYNTTTANNNLWELIALINKNEIISWGCPLVWTVLPDDKNAKFLRNYINAPQTTLYDVKFYESDKGQTGDFIKYKRSIKTKYLAYINEIFDTTMGTGHGLSAEDVFTIESEIINAFNCKPENKKNEFYNAIDADKAMDYNFNWAEFCRNMGFKKVPDFFVCGDLNYLKCMCAILEKDWSSQKWKSYWYYIFLRQLIRFHKSWRNIYFKFIDHTINGQQTILPLNVMAIIGMSLTFNTLISNEYIKHFKNDAYLEYAKNMGKDLLTIFKRRIQRNTWLEERTKKNAILKIENINLILGYPNKMREDPLLDYSSDDAWSNILKISEWRTKKYLLLDGELAIDIPYIDWQNLKISGTQPYVVNAYYTPTENSIYIPLAYFQKPFIDLEERGIEYNLSRLGFTLGHEMSHALDDFGSMYDYKGNLNTWTTPKDLERLHKIQDDITKQYEAFAKKDGIEFDASIAIGENMADISGLAICEEYLMDFQNKNDDIVPIKNLSFQAFFVYYAINNRQHIYKAAIKSQLKVNPHPLDKYRTNVPLSRLKLFRSIYNVKKTNDMFWNSTNTIF